MRDARPGGRTGAGLIAMLGSLSARKAFPLLVASLAILLALPSLGVGWIMDDYYHRVILLERSPLCGLLGKPSEMFRFFTGDPARTEGLMDVGIFPWWTDPGIKGEFLQALAVLAHRLDYLAWPNSSMLMHAQSLAWLGAAAAMASLFYRRMFGATWVAAAAALLFALDDARGATVGFIANRNVLVAATFGFAALICHDRWRRDGAIGSAFLAPVLLLAALFSKEEGIGACAYLGAYALFVGPSGVRRGCLALLPAIAATVGWWLLRASWGYGVRDMGIYIDPAADPGPFLMAAVWRIPILLLGQWSPVPAEADIILGRFGSLALWAAALGFLGLLAWAFAPLLRRDRLARFWGAGMLLATLPVAATAPMDRLLTFAGLGAAGLLARFWAFTFGGEGGGPVPGPRWRRLAVPMAWSLVAVHAVLAPVALPFRAANPIGLSRVERRLYVPELPGLSPGGRTVVVVNAPSPVHAGYLPLVRESAGLAPPRHVRVLAPAIPAARIRRLDERTLAIRPEGGYLREILDRIFRSERRPMSLGEEVRLTGLVVTITESAADGRPIEATFRFDRALEDPSLEWLCFRGRGFEPFILPGIGEEVEIRFDWRAMLAP